MKQSSLIADYNDKYRPKFNDDLFNKNDEDIIQELKNVILSCQRDSRFFTIKVTNFTEVDDYTQIQELLKAKEESLHKRSKSSKKIENCYDNIELKDSDIKLLIIDYFISIKGESDTLTVYLAVPRLLNKFYFRLSGNMYSAMYQIVENSTYNNTTSTNSKSHRITFRTMMANLNMYRGTIPIKLVNKEEIKCTYYSANVFNKSICAMKYILAKYGYDGTLDMLGIPHDIIGISTKDPELGDDWYTIQRKENLYFVVPKQIFDKDQVVQCLIYALYQSTMKRDVNMAQMCQPDFWIKSLALDFKNENVNKGYAVLDSIEHIYDISTKNMIRLPEEMKADIYCILKWMMCEFSNIRIKDNLDLAIKRVRFSEYIAAMYSAKLSKGIYHVADLGNSAELDSIKKAINISPMFLIEEMQRSKLVNYRDSVNDLDTFAALKFTYKGIAGIGEKSSSAVPTVFRAVNPSHLGRVDLNTSSNSDPGLSGMLCPLTTLHDNGFFENTDEPVFWKKEFDEILSNFRKIQNLKQLYTFKEKLGIKDQKQNIDQINELEEMCKAVIPKRKKSRKTKANIPLEDSGLIRYE